MTLLEAIQEVERQMKTFSNVYIDEPTFTVLEESTRRNDEWSGLSSFRYRMVRNKFSRWVYEMTPAEAKRAFDAGHEALARQVADKLTGK